MPRMKVLSGREIVRFLERSGFILVSQNGSHIKMIHTSIQGSTIIVPNHREVKRGLLGGIIKKCMECLESGTVRDFFYTK